MPRVLVKAEYHSSMGDLDEEKELVKEGFDTLVLEGQASKSEYGWSEGWFQISVFAMFWLIDRIYVDKEILRELARLQDTKIKYTREEATDLLENTPWFMKLFSAATFYTLVPGSVPLGILYGKLLGAGVMFAGFAVPVLGIRLYNSWQTEEEKNRDKIMADKITEAVENGDSVLAIVGEAHRSGVLEHLPEDIEPETREPAYPRHSRKHIKEVAFPFFEMVLVLYSLYLLVSWILIQATVLVNTFL